jgi:hypothetical protein
MRRMSCTACPEKWQDANLNVIHGVIVQLAGGHTAKSNAVPSYRTLARAIYYHWNMHRMSHGSNTKFYVKCSTCLRIPIRRGHAPHVHGSEAENSSWTRTSTPVVQSCCVCLLACLLTALCHRFLTCGYI